MFTARYGLTYFRLNLVLKRSRLDLGDEVKWIRKEVFMYVKRIRLQLPWRESAKISSVAT
jgi:hypothetical protein